MVIRKIGVFSAGKLQAVLGVLVGLLIGAFVSIFSILGGSMAGADAGPIAKIIGMSAIVVLPIVYGITCFITGVIGALIFNLACGLVGGLHVETD